ncbi:MAG: hypothetical protein ACR2GA_06850 [Chloroflexota bacterium]
MLVVFPRGAVGAAQSLPPVTNAGVRLGLCDVLPGAPPAPNSPTWAQLASQAGARWNRWEFRWDHIEPQAGQWNFVADDAAVAASRQAGLSILGILDGTPQWGAAPGQPRGNGVPRDLSRGINDPANLWAGFVRGVVTHYRGQVRAWGIWNEPDLHFFWNGNADDYYRTLQVAYRVIKQVDPTARVLIAGMVVPDLLFLSTVLQRAAADVSAGNGPSFDVAAWHVYGPASEAFSNVAKVRALLTANGFAGVPVWVTEDGFPASNPAGEARQAAYVLQTVAFALAAGAARVLVYRGSDDPTPHRWGLLTAVGGVRMGYVAFQVAAQYLSTEEEGIVLPSMPGVDGFVFYGPRERVFVLWNTGQQTQTVTVPTGQLLVQRVDWQGVTQPLVAQAGMVNVDLPGATYNAGVDPSNSVVGGPPVLLVEDDTLAPAGAQTTFLPPISGGSSPVTLFNPGDVTLPAVISSEDQPHIRQVIQIPPHGLATADPAFLAGSDFHDVLRLDVPAPAIGAMGTGAAVAPSRDWYLAARHGSVQLISTAKSPVAVNVNAYGSQGRLVRHQVLSITRTASVIVSAAPHHQSLSFHLHAGVPILVTGGQGRAVAGTSALQTDWYVLHPENSPIHLFNPSARSIVVHVRRVGAPSFPTKSLRLGAHHTFTLASVGAGTRVLHSASSFAASTGNPDAGMTIPQRRAVFVSAGKAGRIDLFDPASGEAHVVMTVVTAQGSRVINQIVRPNQALSVRLRLPAQPAGGITVTSDVSVISQISS